MRLTSQMLDILGVVVGAADDDKILQTPGHVEGAVAEEAQVARPKVGSAVVPCSASRERRRCLLGTVPVAGRDSCPGHPYLADDIWWAVHGRAGLDNHSSGIARRRTAAHQRHAGGAGRLGDDMAARECLTIKPH